MPSPLDRVTTLTFDIFGTVLDLTGSIVPVVRDFLAAKGSPVDPDQFWRDWRARQRIEQHQDTILMLGHSGYLEAARREFRSVAKSADRLGALWLYATFSAAECDRRIGTLATTRRVGDKKTPLARYLDAIEGYEQVEDALLDFRDENGVSLKAASLFYRAELHLCIAAGFWDRYATYTARQRAKNRRGHHSSRADAKTHFEAAEIAWLQLVYDHPDETAVDGESWDERIRVLADELTKRGMVFTR